MTGRTLCFRVVRPSVRPSVHPSVRHALGEPLCVQRPAKNYAFSTNYHACIAMPTWRRCAPPILFWPWPPYNLLPRSCLTWIFFRWSSLMVNTLCAVPSKGYAFSTNYHACIALPTWCRCAPPLWIFFADADRWVPLCVQRPAKAMPFQQISIHALKYQHDIDVHLLFCFDLDLLIACSRGHV